MNIEIHPKKERDNLWLEERLYGLWEEYFNDVPRTNVVLIKFGKYSSTQLGSIKWANHKTRIKHLVKNKKGEIENQDDKRISLITITSLYKDTYVPEYVVDETIAHEMIHYAHGFNSPLQQIYDHPHKGGIIRKEMIKRGLSNTYKMAKKWMRENWREYVREHM